MKEEIIGIVTMGYNEDGVVVEAGFKPQEQTDFDKGLLRQLQSVPSSDDIDVIKKNAANVISQWFTKISDIELLDLYEYQIVGEVIDCVKYAGGKVKKCSIQYRIKKLENEKVI